jgi:hypothetical protein
MSTQPEHLSRVVTGRDEMNFAEFPIALLSDRAPAGQNTLVFEDTVRDKGTGQPVVRKLTIRGADGLGLPTSTDADVLIALIQVTKQRSDFGERRVHFTRYELIKFLGWPDKGASYRRLREAFDRWMGVYLTYDNAWWDNRRKSWVTEKFHVLDNVTIYEREPTPRKNEQNVLPFSSFVWNEVVFRSFRDGYLKRLDLDFFFSLGTATAKQMYRFLDKHFHHAGRLEYDLETFAFQHVGLSRSSCKAPNGGVHTGKIREKLGPAVKELEERGFLEPLPLEERFRQVRRGEWRVVFVEHRGRQKGPKELVAPPKVSPLEQALIDRGVTPAIALDLVAHFKPDRIQAQLEVFDTLAAAKDKRVSKNPAGFLVKAIQKDYLKPKDVETPTEKRQKAERKTQAEQRAAEAAAKREAAEKARLAAERAPLEAYWDALTPAQQRELEAEAVRTAEPWIREKLTGKGAKPSALADAYRRAAIDRLIRQRLAEPTLPGLEDA